MSVLLQTLCKYSLYVISIFNGGRQLTIDIGCFTCCSDAARVIDSHWSLPDCHEQIASYSYTLPKTVFSSHGPQTPWST